MRSKIFQEVLDETPKDVEIFVKLYADIVLRVNQLLKEKGLTQKSLAEKLDKRPSEIHKWLSGEHNFTLRSIAKLQAALGEILLEVPVRNPITEFHSYDSIKIQYVSLAGSHSGIDEKMLEVTKEKHDVIFYSQDRIANSFTFNNIIVNKELKMNDLKIDTIQKENCNVG